MYLCKFGQNPITGSEDNAWKGSCADANLMESASKTIHPLELVDIKITLLLSGGIRRQQLKRGTGHYLIRIDHLLSSFNDLKNGSLLSCLMRPLLLILLSNSETSL